MTSHTSRSSRLRALLEAASAQPLGIAERLSAVTHLLSSLEYLARREDREPGGLNDWRHLRHQIPTRTRTARRVLDWVAREPVTRAVHATRILAAAALVAPVEGNRVRLACDAYLSLTQFVVYPRHFFGTDGSDQVSFLVQTAAALGRTTGTEAGRTAAAQFIGAQGVLAYGASGWAKLAGSRWRSGDALVKIIRTQTYGDRWLYEQLCRFPAAARALCHAVLVLECGFPLLLLRRGRHIDAGLLMMATFHLANARFMGLSRFVWAFLSTYPGIRLLARGPR